MKRIAAAPLWFLVGWYAGSAIAWVLGVGPVLAPIVAVALTGLVVADPLRVIWNRQAVGETGQDPIPTTNVDAPAVAGR
jgi:hypothetical protein